MQKRRPDEAQPDLRSTTFAIHDSDEDDSDAAGDLSKLLAR